MKKLLRLLAIAAVFACGHAYAQMPSLIYCIQATLTPCNSLSQTNPYTGQEGDFAYQFNTKTNTNWLFVQALFSLPNNTLVGNSTGGPNGINAILLGSGLSLSGNVLNASGGGGGGGGSFAFVSSGTNTNALTMGTGGVLNATGGQIIANYVSVLNAAVLGSSSSGQLFIQSTSGTGSVCFTISCTMVTPNLGTPSAVNLSNATGLPLFTGVIGTLPTTNGGTGATSFAAAGLLTKSGAYTVNDCPFIATTNGALGDSGQPCGTPGVSSVAGAGQVTASPTTGAAIIGLASESAFNFLGNCTASTAIPIACTPAQALAALNSTACNQQNANYTTILTDGNGCVQNAGTSAITYTIPPNSSVAYPVGYTLTFLNQNTGSITATAGAGVTFASYQYAAATSVPTAGQYDFQQWKQMSANTWELVSVGTGRQFVTQTVVSGTTIAPVITNANQTEQTNTASAGTLTISNPTGTPFEGQTWRLVVTCTNSQTFSWGSAFEGSTTAALPTTTTGSAKTDYYGFVYHGAATSPWQMVGSNTGFN